MSEQRVIVVTGATGQVGQKVAQRLLAAGHPVRAVARTAANLQPLSARGADVRPGSLENQAFLTSVFRGAAAVLAVVPQTTDVGADDPVAEHTRIANSLAGAIRQSGVRQVVSLSSWGAEVPGKATGPIAALHHFEELLDDTADLSVVHLRPGHFMENRLRDIRLISSAGVLGNLLTPDLLIPMVATQDVAAVAAEHLADGGFTGRTVRYLLGPRDYTMTETARILGEAIGRPDLAYVQFPETDFRAGLIGSGFSPGFADAYVEMVRGFNTRLVKGEPRSATNTTPTTLEEFATDVFAPAFSQREPTKLPTGGS
jgi:uncharacterized protein YbjT (DUF2867 family)